MVTSGLIGRTGYLQKKLMLLRLQASVKCRGKFTEEEEAAQLMAEFGECIEKRMGGNQGRADKHHIYRITIY